MFANVIFSESFTADYEEFQELLREMTEDAEDAAEA